MRSIFAPPFVVCRRIFVSSYESGGESERAVDQKERFDPIPTVSLPDPGSASGGSVSPSCLSLRSSFSRSAFVSIRSDSRAGRESDSGERSLLSTFKADKYLKESRQAYARNLLAFADDRGAVVVARSDFQPYQRFYFFYHVPCIDAYFIETDNPFRYRASALQSWDIIACTISVLAERTRLRVNRELDSTVVK